MYSYNFCGAFVQNQDTFEVETETLSCSRLSPRVGAKRCGWKILKV